MNNNRSSTRPEGVRSSRVLGRRLGPFQKLPVSEGHLVHFRSSTTSRQESTFCATACQNSARSRSESEQPSTLLIATTLAAIRRAQTELAGTPRNTNSLPQTRYPSEWSAAQKVAGIRINTSRRYCRCRTPTLSLRLVLPEMHRTTPKTIASMPSMSEACLI